MPHQTTARVIADSVSGEVRLTTIEVTFHRFVLAEFNTHRQFSRNSASSRAIPVESQIKRLGDSPAFPISWPGEQPGMQGGSELTDDDLADAVDLFNEVYQFTLRAVEGYVDSHPDKSRRLHKSVLNRLLEPFMWHTVVVSSTEWDNFFGLRCSPLAQPEIRVAAEIIRDVYNMSDPVSVPLAPSDGVSAPENWHLPYVTDDERHTLSLDQLQQISTARCTRVSSMHAGDIMDYEKDYRLFDTLTSSRPPHASPLEHIATPCRESHRHGNFDGWHQLRHYPHH
jgi:hypothetical protein